MDDLHVRIVRVLSQAPENIKVEPPPLATFIRPAEDTDARRGVCGKSRKRTWLIQEPEAGYRLPHRTGWALAAGVVAVVVLAGTLTFVHGDHQSASADPTLPNPLVATHGTHADAVALLTKEASLQATQPIPKSVMYAKTRNYAMSTTVDSNRSTTDVMTTVREVWVSAKGAAKVKEYNQATTPAGGDIGGPVDVGSGDHSGNYPGHSWGDENTTRLTSVDATYAQLEKEVAKEVEMYGSTDVKYVDLAIGADVVDGHLSSGTATPIQLAANYRLLASASDVFYAGQVTDDAGRNGVAVGIQVSDEPSGYPVTVEYFIINPTTGGLLETQIVSSFPPPKVRLPHRPTIQRYALMLRMGSVDQLGQADATH